MFGIQLHTNEDKRSSWAEAVCKNGDYGSIYFTIIERIKLEPYMKLLSEI